MTEMFGEAWSPMSVPDLAPDDDDDDRCDTDTQKYSGIEYLVSISTRHYVIPRQNGSLAMDFRSLPCLFIR